MNKKTSKEPVIFVAGILEKMDGKIKKIFLQTRWKPKITRKYSGLLEIPGGRINDHENIFTALQREVMEECGLKIITHKSSFRGALHKIDKLQQSMVFRPFICQQVFNKNDGKLWLGFVFICEVEGKPRMQKGETKNPQWVSLKELEKLLNEQPEKIFPHQYQALKYYIESKKRS